MTSHQTKLISFVVLLFLVGTSFAQERTQAPPHLDAYVARVQKEFEVPGIAIAIVKDGNILLTKGYGVRKLGDPTPVDEHTLFGIASNTKAFTAAALAMLVDEGKLSWDDPVIKHLPSFQMYDPYVTRELTVRDLLTHRSGLGLGAGDLLFWPGTTFTSEEIVHRIRFLKPATSFRTRYAYDNVLYLVAGQVVSAITKRSWDDVIKERIFARLGMNESNTSAKALKPNMNVVSPHTKIEDRLTPIPFVDLDNTAPAGAINSNVVDMSKWVLLQLDRGRIRGTGDSKERLFSEAQSRTMWSVQTPQNVGEPPPELAALRTNFAGYGLGWGLNDYRGRKIVSHTGGLAGMVSRVALIPEINLGVVVLTNQEAGAAFSAISLHVMDYYLNAPATDWIGGFKTVVDRGNAAAKEAVAKQQGARAANSRPSLSLEKYAGRYNDAWYGEVTIALEKSADSATQKLVLRFGRSPSLVGDLEHWQYDTFISRWRDRSLAADAYVYFALKPDGTIENMKMQPVSPLTDFSYDFQDLFFVPVEK